VLDCCWARAWQSCRQQDHTRPAANRARGVLFEFANLFKGTIRSARNIRQEVADLLTELRAAESLIQKHGGLTVRDLDILEIGVGQLPRQLAYFAMQNRAVGMDLDVVPQGLKILLSLRAPWTVVTPVLSC
jgi:hypothetical protein